MSGKYKVSVVIPTYNREKLIPRAVDSVLNQTLPAFEIIVVDDGSTDNTETVVKEYGDEICYIKQENSGVSAARNKGIRIAKGDVIAFLDSDDEWLPEKLRLQADLMEEYGVSVCITNSIEKGGVNSGKTTFGKSVLSEKLEKEKPVVDAFPMLVEQNFINLSTALVKKECFDKVGMFDESLKATEDTDLWLRLSVHYPFGIVYENLGYRYHQEESLSGNRELQYKGRVAMFNKLLAQDMKLTTKRRYMVQNRRNWNIGRLFLYYATRKKPSAIARFFISNSPEYFFSVMFYKGFYWDYKIWKKNRKVKT